MMATEQRYYAPLNLVLYDAMRAVFRLLLRLLTRMHVLFDEPLPEQGPAIVVVNHLSYVDAPFVLAVTRFRIRALVAERFRRHFLAPVLFVTGSIWVHRGQPDRAAMRAITAILEDGGVIGIAIEGYLSPDGRMQTGKNGVAYVAAKTGAPVIPMAVWSTERVAYSLLRFRRADIYLRAGRPIHICELDVARLESETNRITRSIASMLPEEYRPQERD